MRFDPDRVPSTLETAVEQILSSLEEKDRAFALSHPQEACVHHTFGRALRNAWSLWDQETPLVKHFQERFGLGHADDISGIINTAVWAAIHGVPYDPSDSVRRYKDHWASYGVDPFTGRSIGK